MNHSTKASTNTEFSARSISMDLSWPMRLKAPSVAQPGLERVSAPTEWITRSNSA